MKITRARDLLDIAHERALEEARARVAHARRWRLGVRRAEEKLKETMTRVLEEELGRGRV